MTAHFRPHLRHHHGFTLIELMVALTIGLIIMLAVGRIFLSNQETYRLQTGMARIQENARFIMDQFKRDIGQAGFPAGIQNPFFVATGDATSDGADSDKIAVTYAADTDCVGNTNTTMSDSPLWSPRLLTINRYDVVSGNFRCNGVDLVGGIDNMQFLYGVDTDGAADGIPNQYVNATTLTANNAPIVWSKVVSVRIAVLVNTVDVVNDEGRDPYANKTYTLLDLPPIGPFSDHRGRQVFASTVMLRNYLP